MLRQDWLVDWWPYLYLHDNARHLDDDDDDDDDQCLDDVDDDDALPVGEVGHGGEFILTGVTVALNNSVNIREQYICERCQHTNKCVKVLRGKV